MFLSSSLPSRMTWLGEVQHILRFIVQRERVNFPPLHLPSVKMVEIKARARSQTVFNFRTFPRSWVPGKPQECVCRTWCSSDTGHWFAHVGQILPASPLAEDLNLSDTTFLSDRQWTRIAGKELRMWCNRWRLPDRVHSGLLHWMQQQLICIIVHYSLIVMSYIERPNMLFRSFEDWCSRL